MNRLPSPTGSGQYTSEERYRAFNTKDDATSKDGDMPLKAVSEQAARRPRASEKAPFVKDLPVSDKGARRTAAVTLFPIPRPAYQALESTSLFSSPKHSLSATQAA